jgi:hypothetical protein
MWACLIDVIRRGRCNQGAEARAGCSFSVGY